VFGEKEFNLVVTPIHPPRDEIKILSIWSTTFFYIKEKNVPYVYTEAQV
jgi:hypothetical protein